MARFQEKEKVFSKHPKLEKALFWSLMGVFAAITIALIVIIVLIIIGPSDDTEEEKVFDETYPTAELITFEDLAEFFSNDSTGTMPDGVDTVYVYIYSPDYTKDEDGNIVNNDEVTALRNRINNCIELYSEGNNNGCVFYVINVTTKENKEYLANNSSFLSTHNIPENNPAFVTISATNNADNGLGVIADGTFDASVEYLDLAIYLDNVVIVNGTEE